MVATPSPSNASTNITLPPQFKIVGVLLAVASGFLIGSSFVFKKKGLLRSQAGAVAGEGVAYLKSPLWWTGMTMMILGELCNFAAYAFVEALVVTPLGALSVVICAILSSLFLKETLTFFGWLGCALCIVGSVVIALNTPPEATVGQIEAFQHLFLAPGFLAWGSFLIAASLTIMFYFGPRYGKNSMLWYIAVCSMIGGLSVSVTTGLGAAIVTSVMGDNQFKHWFIYFLLVFVAVTLITEVYYLNMALALFNTAMVTPTYYVIFTFCTLVTTIVLFQGLKASAAQIITLVMGFLVICIGITILQMSKVDPQQLGKLDRRSTMLLQAARQHTEVAEKNPLMGVEEPGVDALRGGFGTLGSIMRARSARRLSTATNSTFRGRRTQMTDLERAGMPENVERHQLYDPPVPGALSPADDISLKSQPSALTAPATSPGGRTPTIKFQEGDVRHFYPTSPGPAPRLPPPRDVSSDRGARTAPPRLDDDEPNATPGRRAGNRHRPFAKHPYAVTEEDREESMSLVSAAAAPSASDADLPASISDSTNASQSSIRLVAPRPGMI